MVMSQTFATRFSVLMAGEPTSGIWKSFTTTISSLTLSLFRFRVPINCPQRFSEFIPGPNSVRLGSLIVALNDVAMASGMAVTSAPASILQALYSSTALLAILLCDCLLSVLYLEMHFLILLVYHSLLSRFSFLDLHWDWKCPIFLHLRHTESFAGQFCLAWEGIFPRLVHCPCLLFVGLLSFEFSLVDSIYVRNVHPYYYLLLLDHFWLLCLSDSCL